MENEIWKDIEGYEGLYQVSNQGRVRSLNYRKTGKTQVLKPGLSGNGYLNVQLVKNNKIKHVLVHRLVALAFIPNPDNKPQINHKSEDKTLNTVENIEWATAKENINWGTRNKKVANKLSKPIAQKKLDGTIVKIWPSVNEAGRNGFEQANICDCCNGKRKTHKGYLWAFVQK